MNYSFSTTRSLWLGCLAFLIALVAAAGVALQKIYALSLPLSPALGFATAFLPVLAALSIPAANFAALQSTKSRRGRNRQNFSWLAIALPIFFTVYETAVATLALTHMSGPERMLCELNERWSSLYSNKNAGAIKKIQDTYECCGLHTVKDKAYPFPSGSHPDYDACSRTFQRNKSCFAEWKQAEQVSAGLLLTVAVVVFVTKFTILFLLHPNVAWFERIFGRSTDDRLRRQILPAPVRDEEEADSGDEAQRGPGRIGYRDDPDVHEEDEDATLNRSTVSNGNTGPRVLPSGLAPQGLVGGNEWN